MADSGSLVGDLEIIAGHIWSGVGGPMPAAGGGANPLAQEVHFEHVDPKKFGIEIAGCEPVEWVAGEEGATKKVELGTLRVFKPMDMIITSILYGSTLGLGLGYAIIAGAVEIADGNVDIGGTNQFTAKNPVPDSVFGNLFSAPRPRIQFGSVQTAPKLVVMLKCILPAGTIAAVGPSNTGKLRCYITFGGVAARM